MASGQPHGEHTPLAVDEKVRRLHDVCSMKLFGVNFALLKKFVAGDAGAMFSKRTDVYCKVMAALLEELKVGISKHTLELSLSSADHMP